MSSTTAAIPIRIPSSRFSTSSTAMTPSSPESYSPSSSPSGKYVPVHKRSPSSSSSSTSSSSSAAHPYIYTRDALLSFAPPSSLSSLQGATAPAVSAAAVAAASPAAESHDGWTRANDAMRTYLRATCPEVAMNRKMRKALEYHQYHHHQPQRTTARQHGHHAGDHSDAESSSESSSSSSPPSAAAAFPPVVAHRYAANAKQEQVPATRPSPVHVLQQRVRSPAVRRARHANFMGLHMPGLAGGEGNWRAGGAPVLSH